MNRFKLRFVPLGGVVGVTKNMYLYEVYDNGELEDILVVDCGIGFPHGKELGVDLIIPDISYLKDKINKIRAIILSHGHEDHTSALPYYYHSLGSPPLFASKLTSVFVENKLKEFNIKAEINQVDYRKIYRINSFQVEFIPITHSIPDTLHILIKTPVGTIYHGTDFKFDLTPPYGRLPDFYKITRAGQQGVLCLLSDCLGAEREGLTLSESIVSETFENEMRKTRGRFIMTTFSSNISRIRQCVEVAVKFNRKIVFLGRSMKQNTEAAKEIGYLPIPERFLIKEEAIPRFPPHKLCIIAAGSQGQYDSALSKIANKQNPYLKITPGDKVVFSSDPIPGNEEEVYSLIEQLSLQGADVVYSDIEEQLHASGHGNQEDLKFLIRFTNPRYFIPIGGTIRHQRQYQRLVKDLGYSQNRVFMLTEGETVWFEGNRAYKGKTITTKNIYVDAYGIGDVGSAVLEERKLLSSEGLAVVLIIVNRQGQLLSRPKIITRGFVFPPQAKKLFNKAVSIIERILKPRKGRMVDINRVKKKIKQRLEEFFEQEKGRRPLIVVEAVQISQFKE